MVYGPHTLPTHSQDAEAIKNFLLKKVGNLRIYAIPPTTKQEVDIVLDRSGNLFYN